LAWRGGGRKINTVRREPQPKHFQHKMRMAQSAKMERGRREKRDKGNVQRKKDREVAHRVHRKRQLLQPKTILTAKTEEVVRRQDRGTIR